MTDTSNSPSTAPKETEREIAFEHLVSGHLALQVLRNQLDTQIAGLQAQLAVAQAHKRHAEDLLTRADEKLAKQHPEAHAAMMIEVIPRESRPARR